MHYLSRYYCALGELNDVAEATGQKAAGQGEARTARRAVSAVHN